VILWQIAGSFAIPVTSSFRIGQRFALCNNAGAKKQA